eukprot:gene1400-32770_t
MPELAEVEAARKLMQEVCGGRSAKKIWFADDEKVLVNCTKSELEELLPGLTISQAQRKGKHTIDPLKTGWANGEHPRFCKMHIELDNGICVAFTDPRRFARIRLFVPKPGSEEPLKSLTPDAYRSQQLPSLDGGGVLGLMGADPGSEEPMKSLAPDAYHELPSLDEFCATLSKRKCPIKALLLAQEALVCGIGNWIADEVLYQALIHPEQMCNSLSKDQVALLRDKIIYVLKLAVDVNADHSFFPTTWLFHYRWTGQKASSIGGKAIDFIKVGSRTSAYVPALQKLLASELTKAAPAKGRATGRAKKGAKDNASSDDDGDDFEDDTIYFDAKPRAPKRAAPKVKREGAAKKQAVSNVSDVVVLDAEVAPHKAPKRAAPKASGVKEEVEEVGLNKKRAVPKVAGSKEEVQEAAKKQERDSDIVVAVDAELAAPKAPKRAAPKVAGVKEEVQEAAKKQERDSDIVVAVDAELAPPKAPKRAASKAGGVKEEVEEVAMKQEEGDSDHVVVVNAEVAPLKAPKRAAPKGKRAAAGKNQVVEESDGIVAVDAEEIGSKKPTRAAPIKKEAGQEAKGATPKVATPKGQRRAPVKGKGKGKAENAKAPKIEAAPDAEAAVVKEEVEEVAVKNKLAAPKVVGVKEEVEEVGLKNKRAAPKVVGVKEEVGLNNKRAAPKVVGVKEEVEEVCLHNKRAAPQALSSRRTRSRA